MKNLKEKKGFVSIEIIVIVALVLALGFGIIYNLFNMGKEITAMSSTIIYEQVESKLDDVYYTPPIDDQDYWN